MIFDGCKIRDSILKELKDRISEMKRKPTMAVFLIGDDPVSVNYVALKQRLAAQTGINFKLYKYGASVNQDEVLSKIKQLDRDEDVAGIMIQIPVPSQIDREAVIAAISPHKDIDGLRYCQGLESDFYPPVVLAIKTALSQSGVDLTKVTIAIIGKGFLVGNPLYRCLSFEQSGVGARIKTDSSRPMTSNSIRAFDLIDSEALSFIKGADVVISATGQAGLIKPEMVKSGVVLIDAGTSESGGRLVGDIDSAAYAKASFYAPVPGGIGPMTIAMLLKNLVN